MKEVGGGSIPMDPTCPRCDGKHGASLGYICIGCPCPQRPHERGPFPEPAISTSAELDHLRRELAKRDMDIIGLRKLVDDYRLARAALCDELSDALARRDLDLAQAMAESARHEAAGKAMAGEMERLRERNVGLEALAGYEQSRSNDARADLDIATAERDELRARLAVVEPVFEAAKAWLERDGAICLDHQGCEGPCRACTMIEAIESATSKESK